jgi:hypothetical protein
MKLPVRSSQLQKSSKQSSILCPASDTAVSQYSQYFQIFLGSQPVAKNVNSSILSSRADDTRLCNYEYNCKCI